MTSTGSAQNVPAPKPSAPIVASYASAASASGKTSSSSKPVISTGSSTAPVVATPSNISKPAAPGNARTASVSPLNGSAGSSSNLANTAIMSANPSFAAQNGGNSSSSTTSSKPVTPAVPAVINGSTADHARNSSVTIVATAPNGYVSNGVSAGPQPKFGFESPAMGYSSPQPNTAGQRIPSPAHSPIPIPQPSASGGRPPSMTADGSSMKFGSFGGDGDRHLKHNFTHMPANLPAGNSSPHLRRGSSHSVHSDMGNPAGRDSHMSHGPGNHAPHHGGPSGRGGFSSGNRGRGGYNNHNGGHNHFNGQSMPFQPQGQYPRGPPSQGPRNTGAPPFQPRNVMNPGFGPGSPQTSTSRASPAVPPILPSGTPQMQGVVPVPGGSPYMPMQYSTPTGFPPQPNNYPPFQQNYNMGYPAYQGMNPYAAPPPPQQGHGYQQHPYGAQQFVPPVAQPMSRTSSQAASERPNSSMGQIPTPSSAHASLAIPGSTQKPGTNFVKPKKNAIVIKNPQGETIDFNKKTATATPAPAVNPPAVSRTPPVVTSTPPPPPKSTTPSHARTDSAAGTQSIAARRNYGAMAGYPGRMVELFEQWRASQIDTRTLREEANAVRKQITNAPVARDEAKDDDADDADDAPTRESLLERARVLKQQLASVKADETRLASEIQQLAAALPNLTSAQTPDSEQAVLGYFNCDGEGPDGNPTSDSDSDSGTGIGANYYTSTSLMQTPDLWRSHVYIGAELGLMDFSAASAASGWGWYYLLGDGARLEQALVQYALNVVHRHGWQLVSPPSIVRSGIAAACGFQPRDQGGEQQTYSLQGLPLTLTATAEIPLAALYADATIEASTAPDTGLLNGLPLRRAAVSRCYRAEAGARGANTKGLYRVHEFTKVELFAWTEPDLDIATDTFDELVDIQTEILSSLGLPCRVLEMPATDLGASAYRKIDIEAFFPGRCRPKGNQTADAAGNSPADYDYATGWGEVTSASICTDYQSRRLATRARINGGPLTFPWTLNGTALAVPRVLAAILENGWDEETKSVTIPECLQPWMDGQETIQAKQ